MSLRSHRRFAQCLFGICATALILNACSLSLFAQGNELPDAQELITKYIDALGGKDALEKVQTVKITGTMELPQDQEATFVTYFGKDRFYRKMDLPNATAYEQGYNGEVAWEKNPSLGDRKLEGTERADFIRRMDHSDMLTWAENFDGKITTKAKGISVRGVDCYEVEFAPTSGNRVSRFFDQKTGLLIKVATILDSPNGALAVDIFYDDYKKVSEDSEAVMSMKRTQEINGQQIAFVYDKVEVLDAFPEEFTAVPDDLG